MRRTLCILTVPGLAVAATPHYAKPPCLSDETELEVKDYETNYTGKVCAPACGDANSCPHDKPPSAANPKCLLHDSGKKYCGLSCFIGCGNSNLTCLKLGPPSHLKVCAYRNKPELTKKPTVEAPPIEAVSLVTPHYAKPPCLSDETELEVKDYETNYTGKVCAPACGDSDSCPHDKPPSAASPKCLLHDSGKKYCGLSCFIGCGNSNMTCLKLGAPSHLKVCAYRNAVSAGAVELII